jgi:hypothetical protein
MNIKKVHITLTIICFFLTQISCKKFLEIEAPVSSLVQETVFQSDDVATSAMTGIYTLMAASGYASGSQTSITVYGGLTSDEFKSYNAGLNEFFENQISATNINVSNLWSNLYQRIYAANAMIEGLDAATNLTPSIKLQLKGEALFIRAFNYFYLVNLFGPVPLNLSTDYTANQAAKRTPENIVYQQIIADLKSSEGLLSEDYVTSEKVRPNASAARALLARTYLYLEDWENAEKYATLVIGKNIYNLIALDDVFLKNSKEAIWQLMPAAGTNTLEGNLFILNATPVYISLDEKLVMNGFETNDKRKTSWIRSFSNSTGTYFYPFKYKVKSSTAVTEYSMVLRLAEQYLIRSEARANRNNIIEAIKDIDAIRNRAGLALLSSSNPNIGKSNLLNIIQGERKIELLSEWGHRWFDLKRIKSANEVLSLIKPNWQPTDLYYPISQIEISRNINIIQNEGY